MELKEFLNPNSTLTPGVAGAMTMIITNTLASQFAALVAWVPEIGLLISFLFGLMVMAAAAAVPFWQRSVYYILNSLIIFTVAVGSNTLGVAATKGGTSSSAGLSAAYAQPRTEDRDSQRGWCCLNERVNQSSWQECNKWGGQFFSTKEEAEELCFSTARPSPPPEPRGSKGFFRPWF
jgi:hypothetical protein